MFDRRKTPYAFSCTNALFTYAHTKWYLKSLLNSYCQMENAPVAKYIFFQMTFYVHFMTSLKTTECQQADITSTNKKWVVLNKYDAPSVRLPKCGIISEGWMVRRDTRPSFILCNIYNFMIFLLWDLSVFYSVKSLKHVF